jgi:uracil-DNA glycosylase family 4
MRMNTQASWETDWHIARACLEWQVEMGAQDAICEAPVDRYTLDPTPVAAPSPEAPKSVNAPASPGLYSPDPVAEAQAMAAAAPDLDTLRAAMSGFAHCDLKLGARNLVFSDGQPNARVMIVGEAPGREEDRSGKPFIGQAGQMLDRMLAAINLRRDHSDPAYSVYITNILPWRPPQDREPSADERAMFRPFVMRHVELIQPEILILMGRVSAVTLLQSNEAITRIRGQSFEVAGRPALPMLHPAYLFKNPAAKREAWADLLDLQARLRKMS